MLASTLALGGLALLPMVPWQEAQDAPEELLDADELDALLAWRTGEIPLGDGIATLHLPDGFRYLPPEQTKGVLEEVWGNPPRDLTMGMIFPPDQGPFDENSGPWCSTTRKTATSPTTTPARSTTTGS